MRQSEASAAAGAPRLENGSGAPSGSSAPAHNADTAPTTTGAIGNQAPEITVNANNPAIVQVGVSFADLSAHITALQEGLTYQRTIVITQEWC